MKSLARVLVPTAFIVAVALLPPAHAARARHAPLPSRASVEKILQTLWALNDTVGIAMIAATPPFPGPENPFSLRELEAHLALLKREEAFLKGIHSGETLEAAKAKASAYLRSPSARSADSLELTLRMFVRQLYRDMETPLWRAMVPPSKSVPIVPIIQRLERQIDAMRGSVGVVSRTAVSPQRPVRQTKASDGRLILYPDVTMLTWMRDLFESCLALNRFHARAVERAHRQESTSLAWIPEGGADRDSVEAFAATIRERCNRIDDWVIAQDSTRASGIVYLRFLGPNGYSQMWSWQMPRVRGNRDFWTELVPAELVRDPLTR